MDIKKYLDLVAYVGRCDALGFESNNVYYSKFDGSYIAHVGSEDEIKHLADMEITRELTHGVGFSPKDKKWYGWSHRAIFGFGIGHTVVKGDCNYIASTPEELIEDRVEFFRDISEDCANRARAECVILNDRSGIRILSTPVEIPVIKDLSQIGDVLGGVADPACEMFFADSFHEEKCGKGEWTAKTLDDAKLMAIDFNAAVS